MNNTYEEDMHIIEAVLATDTPEGKMLSYTLFKDHFNPAKAQELVEENQRLREILREIDNTSSGEELMLILSEIEEFLK